MREEESSRRDFLRRMATGASGLYVAPGLLSALEACSIHQPPIEAKLVGWDRVPGILTRIVPPNFPGRDHVITSYGAHADAATDCTDAIRQAIAACNAAGGGRVVVPPGPFLTGAIHLRSNVNLHLMEGSRLMFHPDPRAYLPAVLTRFEGMEMMGYSPLIYAFEQENVAITGTGMLDGQANDGNWWPWSGGNRYGWKTGDPNQRPARERLMKMVEDGAPVAVRDFAQGSYLRPQFIQPYRCRNVLIEDVRVVNSPMWEIHPVLCTNVMVRRVKIRSHGPNNDGCDPESCRDVLIEGCEFDTGDDCIAIKSGRNADGRRLRAPTENVIVRNCNMKDGHGGVTIGSEISGDVRWVFAEKCTMDSPNLDRALRLKTNAMRGGTIEHVFTRDLSVGEVSDAVVQIDYNYEEGTKGSFAPVVRDINIERVSSRKSKYALYLRGFPNAPISDVRLVDCRFQDVANGNVLENVRGLTLVRVTVNGKEP